MTTFSSSIGPRAAIVTRRHTSRAAGLSAINDASTHGTQHQQSPNVVSSSTGKVTSINAAFVTVMCMLPPHAAVAAHSDPYTCTHVSGHRTNSIELPDLRKFLTVYGNRQVT